MSSAERYREALNRLGISDPRDYAPPPPAQLAPERVHSGHPREQLRPRLPPGFHVPALFRVAARKHVPAGHCEYQAMRSSSIITP